jgi:hypothetical protein
MSPAFTKPTTITVVAEEDCTTVVTKNPVRTPKNLLEVMADRILLIFWPATLWSDSLIIFIP